MRVPAQQILSLLFVWSLLAPACSWADETKPHRVYVISEGAPSAATTLFVNQAVHAFLGNDIDSVPAITPFDPQREDELCTNLKASDNDRIFVIGYENEQRYDQYSGIYPTVTRSEARAFSCKVANNAVTTRFEWASIADLHYYYVANPIKAFGVTAALLTSPWINKYRLWLAVPTTILDAFDHHDRVAVDLTNCSMNNLVANYLVAMKLVASLDSFSPYTCKH